jgi:DNA-binding LacI/PurR family transcriptional regulator
MKRVTQGDVAKACRVSSMTVSLALREHRSIPEATRKRIQAVASQLGYRRDPALQALVAHRIGLEKPAYHGTVAWVTAWPQAMEWRENPTYRNYHEAFEKRAQELGYRVTLIWMGDYQWKEAACERALRARGIDGIAFAPLPEGYKFKFSLEEFSVVRLGHSLHEPRIPGVAADLRAAVALAFGKARQRGYQRIGLADSRGDLIRLHGLRSAQFLYNQYSVPEDDRVPPLALETGDSASLLEYVRKERVDALIAVWPDCLNWLLADGLRVPEDFGYIQLGDYGPSHVSLVVEASEIVGMHAMNLLDQRLRHNDRGLSDTSYRITIEPQWKDGATLPRRRR